MSEILHSHYRLGCIELKNRMVMAPRTRNRSAGTTPGDVVATSYAQWEEAGLVVTEGTSPSRDGLGRIQGTYSLDQAAGWQDVTDAVHKNGSRIFLKLTHAGRVGLPVNVPAGTRLVGPSDVAVPGKMSTDTADRWGLSAPHALTEVEIGRTIDEYVDSAKLAVKLGFDGVELDAADGCLIDQFLNVASNKRTDRWGGSVDNRIRFALEVARRIAKAIGADRLGIRVSPHGVFNGMTTDTELDQLYVTLAQELSALRLVYLHTVDDGGKGAPGPSRDLIARMRPAFKGTFILSGGYDARRAEADLQDKRGDLVAFGRPFLANPTPATAFTTGAPINAPGPSTFHTPGEKGYDDYV
jgi:N-ethylmaleimide reductase